MDEEKKIRIYTETGCPRCEEAINYLKNRGVVFEEIKLYKGERPDIVEVPMICLQDKCVIGLKKEEINKLVEVEDGK